MICCRPWPPQLNEISIFVMELILAQFADKGLDFPKILAKLRHFQPMRLYIYILAEYLSYGWAFQLTPAESINETFAPINFWDDKETEQTEPPD